MLKQEPEKFDFKSNISDSYKNFFAMNSKYKKIIMVFLTDFYTNYILEMVLRDHVLN
jgi:hypothetical protein